MPHERRWLCPLGGLRVRQGRRHELLEPQTGARGSGKGELPSAQDELRAVHRGGRLARARCEGDVTIRQIDGIEEKRLEAWPSQPRLQLLDELAIDLVE